MKKNVTRRDFLKLTGLLPISVAASRVLSSLDNQQGQQNVIIIVFDALSAYHISLYGYQRETMPNLSRLAERTVVYHNHYAGGNFTSPGTASLLTGTLPWKNRAFQHNGSVIENFINKNIFSAFPNYHKVAFSHNPWAITLLKQFNEHLDDYIPLERLLLTSDGIIPLLFGEDEDIATVSWIRTIKRKKEGYTYSLFLSHFYEMFREFKISNLRMQYPRGIPSVKEDNYYLLEDAIDLTEKVFEDAPQPFIGYFHFMPPHVPYRTHQDFYGYFKGDGFTPVSKQLDMFQEVKDPLELVKTRTAYDEFILYVDREFGRFYDSLEEHGLLDNTWLVFTSDHGEMFERGIERHLTPVLYEPIVRIPLMIFEPGRKSRIDIHFSTSAIDVLPTLLHVTGQRKADWTDGRVLPPFSQAESDLDRNIYVVQAKDNEQLSPFTSATLALIKEHYKLTYFFGYEKLGANGERIELYNLKNDPEELNDLSSSKRETTAELLDELKQKLVEVNKPYL